jgi:hypothetical protein
VTSAPVTLTISDACLDLRCAAAFLISGQPGSRYVLKYTSELNNTNFSTWIPLATNTMTVGGWFYVDMESPFLPKRFYGVKLQP